MSDRLNTRTARWLLAFFVLLILYGSLFPFTLRTVEFESVPELLGRVGWGPTTPGDIFANLLLYLPLGAALAWALPERLTGLARLLVGVACGALLSFSVEITQLFLARRVSSWADVTMNTAGTFIGCAGALLVRRAADRLATTDLFRITREPVAAALVLIWLATFLPPWLPRFDTARWPAEWARILETDWPHWPLIALGALGWLIAGLALRTLTRPRYVFVLLLLLACAALTVQYTAFVRFAGRDEIAGALVGLALWPIAARVPARAWPALFYVLLAGLLAWRGLEPFEFTARPHEFRLVPFEDLIARGSTGFNLPLFFGKAFWYGSLVWLLAKGGAGPLFAGVFTAGLLLLLEIAQAWTPPGYHVATITDPLIALAAALVLSVLGGERVRGAAALPRGTVVRKRRSSAP